MEFKTVSAIRGHHIYKSIWGPETGEILSTKKERNNPHDRFAVAVMKDKLTVGHIPREISKICWFFLHKGGTIQCTVTGGRRRSLIEQGGLEVPCELSFSISDTVKDGQTIMSKLRKLLD